MRISTKEKIFYAAVQLFSEKSYASVSVREIAEKVGIQAGSIYVHYQSKEEILNEILMLYQQRMKEFYDVTTKRMDEPDYEPSIRDVLYSYSSEEVPLMYHISRIAHMEQFNSPIAADTMRGSANQNYFYGNLRFLERLADLGVLSGKEKCPYYADMLSRLALSYQIDFMHPDLKVALEELRDLGDMYLFLFEMIFTAEGTMDSVGKIFLERQKEIHRIDVEQRKKNFINLYSDVSIIGKEGRP